MISIDVKNIGKLALPDVLIKFEYYILIVGPLAVSLLLLPMILTIIANLSDLSRIIWALIGGFSAIKLNKYRLDKITSYGSIETKMLIKTLFLKYVREPNYKKDLIKTLSKKFEGMKAKEIEKNVIENFKYSFNQKPTTYDAKVFFSSALLFSIVLSLLVIVWFVYMDSYSRMGIYEYATTLFGKNTESVFRIVPLVASIFLIGIPFLGITLQNSNILLFYSPCVSEVDTYDGEKIIGCIKKVNSKDITIKTMETSRDVLENTSQFVGLLSEIEIPKQRIKAIRHLFIPDNI